MQAYESPFIVLGRRLILTVTAVNAREDHVSVEDCRDYDGGKQRGHEAVFGKGGVDEGQYQGSQVEKADEDKAYGGGDPFFLHALHRPCSTQYIESFYHKSRGLVKRESERGLSASGGFLFLERKRNQKELFNTALWCGGR